jgi:uncharacterized protein (DUF433 family)
MSTPEVRLSIFSNAPAEDRVTVRGGAASDEGTENISTSEALQRSDVVVYPSGSIEVRVGIDIETTVSAFNEQIVKDGFRALADKLCEEHPAISTEQHIFGGIPHIKGVRLSVGDILAKLYTYGNIQEILETYGPHVSEEQIKEAIAYAQDFLEMACDPDESSEIDD